MNDRPVTPFLSEGFQRALELAARGHASQLRKGTDLPYIVHPVRVACLVRDYGGSESAIAAALVHDLPEDTDVSVERIRDELGERVATIVAALTEDKSRPWVMRKRAAIAKFGAADADTRLVAGVDKLDALVGFARDAQARTPAFWERFNAGKALQAWFYHALCNAFDSAPFAGEFRRLTREVFGTEAPAANPGALYLDWALRRRGDDAWKRRMEARTLWLNASEDQAAMTLALDALLADPDVEAASQAALFFGFAGRAWPGADDRLVRVLEQDCRVPVVAAAMVATQVILDDAMEGDSTTPRLMRARDVVARDPSRRGAVVAHLEAVAPGWAGGEVMEAARYLRAAG